ASRATARALSFTVFPTRRSSDLIESHRGDGPLGKPHVRPAGTQQRTDQPLDVGVVADPGDLAVVVVVTPVDQFLEVGARLQGVRSEEHTSELQSRENLVCRLLLE